MFYRDIIANLLSVLKVAQHVANVLNVPSPTRG